MKQTSEKHTNTGSETTGKVKAWHMRSNPFNIRQEITSDRDLLRLMSELVVSFLSHVTAISSISVSISIDRQVFDLELHKVYTTIVSVLKHQYLRLIDTDEHCWFCSCSHTKTLFPISPLASCRHLNRSFLFCSGFDLVSDRVKDVSPADGLVCFPPVSHNYSDVSKWTSY